MAQVRVHAGQGRQPDPKIGCQGAPEPEGMSVVVHQAGAVVVVSRMVPCPVTYHATTIQYGCEGSGQPSDAVMFRPVSQVQADMRALFAVGDRGDNDAVAHDDGGVAVSLAMPWQHAILIEYINLTSSGNQVRPAAAANTVVGGATMACGDTQSSPGSTVTNTFCS